MPHRFSLTHAVSASVGLPTLALLLATVPARGQSPSSGDAPAVSEESAPPKQEAHVVVQGYREGDQVLRSTAAVTVVGLKQAKREPGDMGTVLSRAEGVSVQQVGGLGSPARFSLAGFDDTQVRFFIDGIPLEYQGFSLGLQTIPLNLFERVEIYKGVVPIQFGADSLGGAFNLVSDRRTTGTHASASYQAGSFDTARVTASTRHLDEKSGFFVKTEGFFDSTDNSYPIDVKVGDATGQSSDVTVRRFHDKYRALGANLELGLVRRKWAKRLLLKPFINSYDKDLQHNARMTRPFGEVTMGGLSAGASLRYEQDFAQGLSGTLVSGYVYERGDFLDNPECTYNWLGECVRESNGRSGELRPRPTEQSLWDHSVYLRSDLKWEVRPHHEVRLSTAPTFFTRTGQDHLLTDPDAFTPLRGRRDMFKWISGAEYKVDGFNARLENDLFIKNYFQSASSDELLSPTATVNRHFERTHFGAGDGLRFALTQWAIVKASYEYSVRLPEPRETFGNGAQIGENLELEPERSHNVNLTFLVHRLESKLGRFDASTTGFYRDADNLIVLLGRTDIFFYENVFRAQVVGAEGVLTWLAPTELKEFLELSANATYQDFRNRAEEGAFARFEGDRIPNKPYLFANGRARLQAKEILAPGDELSLTFYTRYVHSFYKNWESVGIELEEEPPVIDSQLIHSAALTYVNEVEEGREISCSLEVQNLTDAKVFDFYGIQRPGRTIFFKTVLTY